MTDQPPDSQSVRPPTTGEYSFEHVAGAAPASPNGSTTAVIAVVAIALIVIIGGAAGLAVLRNGGSDTDATQTEAPATVAGSTTAITDNTVASNGSVPAVTISPDTVLPESTAPPTAPPPPPAPTPAQVGAPTISASVVRQDGLDSCTPPNDTFYGAGLAYDGSTDTAWMAPGDGVGQRLVFTFPSPVTVSEVGLFPGYGKFDPCTADDRFFQLRRIGSVQWSFDDGSVVDQSFTSVKAVQQIPVPPRVTRSVTITIVTTIAPGVAGLDHTPISEVTIS